MNAKQIECKFAMMGARFKVNVVPTQRQSKDYAVDIRQDRRGAFFELRVPDHLRDAVDVTVMQSEPRQRHLLLFIRKSGVNPPGVRSRDQQSFSV